MSDVRLYDKIMDLHRRTTISDYKRDFSAQAANDRLFKNQSFMNEVNMGRIKDVPVQALIVAYIVSQRHDIPRQQDRDFYDGIWKLICEEVGPEGATMAKLPVIPDSKMHLVRQIPDVYRFDIYDIAKELIHYRRSNKLKYRPYYSLTSVNRELGYPTGWIANNKAWKERNVPVAKLMQFVIYAYRFAFIGKLEPYEGFWLEKADLAWQYMHIRLSDNIDLAEGHRVRLINEARGDMQKDIKIRPFGML